MVGDTTLFLTRIIYLPVRLTIGLFCCSTLLFWSDWQSDQLTLKKHIQMFPLSALQQRGG
jgi:hypothetical protein